MRAWPVMVLLLGLTACGVNDPRGQAEELVRPPKLSQVRAGLPATASSALAVTDALPELEHGPTATEDACDLEPGNSGMFSLNRWWEVRCNWRTTRYYGFDGDFAARTQALHDALVAAGWSPGSTSAMTAMDYYRQFYGQLLNGHQYTASNLPEAIYDGHLGNDQPWTVKVQWAEGADLPYEFGRATGDFLHREATEVDREQVLRGLTSRHRYALIVSVATPYFMATVE
ncbi:hypothetical protein ACWGE0_15980 [Lentzea sp. NPDC054927]